MACGRLSRSRNPAWPTGCTGSICTKGTSAAPNSCGSTLRDSFPQTLTLNQSGAIVLYCAEKSGRFIPDDKAARMLAMQWFMQAASDISGTSMTIFRLENTAPQKTPENVDYFKTRLRDAFRVCDMALEGKDYLAGELTVADLMLYPSFALRRSLVEGLDGYDNLRRWADNMAARPGVQRGMDHAA